MRHTETVMGQLLSKLVWWNLLLLSALVWQEQGSCSLPRETTAILAPGKGPRERFKKFRNPGLRIPFLGVSVCCLLSLDLSLALLSLLPYHTSSVSLIKI